MPTVESIVQSESSNVNDDSSSEFGVLKGDILVVVISKSEKVPTDITDLVFGEYGGNIMFRYTLTCNTFSSGNVCFQALSCVKRELRTGKPFAKKYKTPSNPSIGVASFIESVKSRANDVQKDWGVSNISSVFVSIQKYVVFLSCGKIAPLTENFVILSVTKNDNEYDCYKQEE
ncbi:hypothetical protein PPL_04961 [Heterostelium album PN500]|uniref:Uncharacterized protein n=1 Tax=Heterostelium pallidum (strain ATCC 26659 / Pp 5 / PN500) TaxID=670386 RepID=D3B917_HETP5|nr:hypothetical protein PPL_04961 [Heterostelium album PN500]EFA82056.1 hypothetical protein PPL_04961 [Heterostelium album PN500]|eukprot:XP_020434173.1 hypothetical protein PPL_04961 [Heterostelium album PN500]